MIFRILSFVILSVIFVTQSAIAQTETKPTKKPTYKKMPWHLVDTWWDLGKSHKFESLSVDVTLSNEIDDKINLYIAPIGLGYLNKIAFYGGLQTNVLGYTKKNRRLRNLGRGYIFSMWGDRSFDAIRQATDGFCQSSGHEGDFVGVRRKFEWNKGTYTFKLIKMDKQVIGNKTYTWVGSFVYSHATDENAFLGALRFKGEDLMLGKSIANFVEIYGRPIEVEQIPKITIAIGNIHVNSKKIENATASAIYPQGAPDYANVKAQDGNLVITLGQEIKGRTQRTVKLIGKVGKP